MVDRFLQVWVGRETENNVWVLVIDLTCIEAVYKVSEDYTDIYMKSGIHYKVAEYFELVLHKWTAYIDESSKN